MSSKTIIELQDRIIRLKSERDACDAKIAVVYNKFKGWLEDPSTPEDAREDIVQQIKILETWWVRSAAEDEEETQ